MKVLLDENIAHELRPMITGHDVFTVDYMGWKSLSNGALLARAAQHGFDVMITTDAGIEYEQHLNDLPIAVVILRGRGNRPSDLAELVPDLLAALERLRPRTLVHVPEQTRG